MNQPEPPADTQGPHRPAAHFDLIADAYCRKDLLPACRVARRRRLLSTLAAAPVRPPFRLLEAGCGAGFTARYLAGAWTRYCGVDSSGRLVALAQAHNALPGASFHVADACRFDPGEDFDLALAVGVLHHMEEPAAAVRRMAELLRPGGWLLANEPQPANPLVRAARALRRRADRAYDADQRQMPRGELAALLQAAGLTDVRVLPQGLFSTPLAEVALPAQGLLLPLAHLACIADTALERIAPWALRPLSWNLVAAGRKPSPPEGGGQA